jgi:hypothetical protein
LDSCQVVCDTLQTSVLLRTIKQRNGEFPKCPSCREGVLTGVWQCPSCGLDSSAGESLPAIDWSFSWAKWLSTTAILAVAVTLISGDVAVGDDSVSSTMGRRYSHTTRASVCAASYDGVGSVLAAYRESDTAALAGLIARNKAMDLAANTKVSIVSHNGFFVKVVANSGSRKGGSCWIYSGFLSTTP